MNIVLKNVRLSFANLFEPRAQFGGDPKYSTAMLLPKSDTQTMQLIEQAIAEAKQAGLSKKWGGRMPSQIDVAVRDGDGRKPKGEEYDEECRGHWVISAKSDQRPGIVDQRVQPILDSTQVYSGMWANVDVSFYPYNVNGNCGIGIGLNNVQKVADDEPFSGRRAASEVFSAVDTGGFTTQPQPPQQPATNPGSLW